MVMIKKRIPNYPNPMDKRDKETFLHRYAVALKRIGSPLRLLSLLPAEQERLKKTSDLVEKTKLLEEIADGIEAKEACYGR